MSETHRLADLQLAIMQILWDRGEATVGDVRDALAGDRPLAYTTVSTMLTKMERKGQVRRRQNGRVLVYRPRIERDTVRRSMVRDLADRLFRGDVTSMVSHLLDGEEVSAEELQRLRRLIRDREKEGHHGR